IVQIAMVDGTSLYGGNNFVNVFSVSGPVRIEALLAVGDTVAATGRLGMFGADPQGVGTRDVSRIRTVASDESVYVADYAGSSLVRLKDGNTEVLLDTSSQDPQDRVGLVRILRVEAGGNGLSAVLALRADGTRGIYRLE